LSRLPDTSSDFWTVDSISNTLSSDIISRKQHSNTKKKLVSKNSQSQ
jgi:hypothetical protein